MKSGRVWILMAAFCLLIAPGMATDPANAQEYALGVALGLTGTGAPYSSEALEAIDPVVPLR